MTTAENIDCMEGMSRYPNGWFDLGIIDPPYGIERQISVGGGTNTKSRVSFHNLYNAGSKWDQKPPPEYFDELRRVSKNQIIWGGNYFELPPCRGFIIWDKMKAVENFSQAEYAWTSFDTPSKVFAFCSNGGFVKKAIDAPIHPTQKPYALYRWLLQNYAKPGDKILDTHLGSGSSRIAAHDMGFDFTGFELDADHFQAQEKRFAAHIAKPVLFAPSEMYRPTQGTMF